jgi:hypothetical protein
MESSYLRITTDLPMTTMIRAVSTKLAVTWERVLHPGATVSRLQNSERD